MNREAARVLVVDDDDEIRSLVTEIFGDEGYEVRGATNGADALAALEIWRPDAILLDLMMPVMDGWTFRANQLAVPDLARIPVVVISASYARRSQVEDLEASATIDKPFDIDVLLTTVERIVRPASGELTSSAAQATPSTRAVVA